MTATTSIFKAAALQASHTLNPRPERVTALLFHESPFFDARDVVQVKYEMLRWTGHEQSSVQVAAMTFGYSRVAWYQIKTKYVAYGLVGLLPQPRGPRHPQKQPSRLAANTLPNWCSSMKRSDSMP